MLEVMDDGCRFGAEERGQSVDEGGEESQRREREEL